MINEFGYMYFIFPQSINNNINTCIFHLNVCQGSLALNVCVFSPPTLGNALMMDEFRYVYFTFPQSINSNTNTCVFHLNVSLVNISS